jgi:hypothetical protein
VVAADAVCHFHEGNGARDTVRNDGFGVRSPLLSDRPPAFQNSSVFRAAATTRSTDGMYASSICQYGYGTS